MKKNIEFDRLLNINTMGEQEWDGNVKEYHPYQATSYANLNEILNYINIDNNDIIVDFGCGKGRVSFFFNYMTKCKTIGIEFDKNLFDICISNKNTYKIPSESTKIEFFNILAQEYVISEDDNIFYFFNPFSAKIFETILNNITESFFKNQRDIKIILYYPQSDYIDTMYNNPFFDLDIEIKLKEFNFNIDERILIYKFIKW